MVKICNVCLEEKSIDEFSSTYPDKKGRVYQHHQCKRCLAEKQKLYGEKNKEKLRAYHLQWSAENRDKVNKDSLDKYHKINLLG